MKKYYINLTEQERSQIIHSLIDKYEPNSPAAKAYAELPLRYNKDKREKPVFSRGLSVCRSHFNSFSNIETDAKI